MAHDYARFWKCALQVNPSTYSQQFQGQSHGLTEAAFNDSIVERCIANEITVVGIADHGNVANVDSLRAALESSGITVFPGFEIASTEKVHMVCLYPAGTPADKLNQYLGALGLPPAAVGTTASTLSCLEIARKVRDHGGFWFAAHITNANGLLKLNKDGGGLTHIWKDCDAVLAAQIPGDIAHLESNVRQIVENKNPDYSRSRPIALINAKDVKIGDDLNDPRSWTWFKMTTPSLAALTLACRDPQSRVRLPEQINPAFYSRIERIAIERGYLEDFDVSLSPNLNALVGGRGTGKSSLIEAIRFAFAIEPLGKDAQRAHKAIIDGNFAKEKAGIKITITSFQQNCERYTVVRYFGEPAKVLAEDGTVTDLAPADLMPGLEVYGQNELLAIVQDEHAKARLIGRFLRENDATTQALEQLRTSLAENRLELDQHEKRLADVDARLQQLPALLDRQKSFQKLGLETELKQIEVRESERTYVTEALAVAARLKKVAAEFKQSLSKIALPVRPAIGNESHDVLLTVMEAALTESTNALASSAQDAMQSAALADTKISEAQQSVNGLVAKDELVFNAAISNLPTMKGKSVAQLSTEYARVASDVGKLNPLKAQRVELEGQIVALRQTRIGLLEKLASTRNERWTALTKAVKSLNKRVDGHLRVEFEPERTRSPLKEFLLNCALENVGEKRLSWIDDAEALSIVDLVATLRQGAEALLARFKDAGMARSAADAIASIPSSVVRELEEIQLPERVDLLLNVSQESNTYRSVNRLSTGQQCTAILHLLLLDNPDPLVIDQPEDNLDNSFIAGHIVTQLRESKTARQFIFATHNANIPVFGDAEWIGVLEEKDGRGKIQALGSIDDDEVKVLAANILEGGREAFNRRKEKYNF